MSHVDDRIALIERTIRSYPDFPKPGIVFRDIFSVLLEPAVFAALNDVLLEKARACGPVDCVVGLDARGFLFGPLIALSLKLPFVPVRKRGKLPGETLATSYSLEYGEATVEIQKDSIQPGAKCLIIDDLLATGGTLGAACKLLEKIGATDVRCLVVIELVDLKGRNNVPAETISLVQY